MKQQVKDIDQWSQTRINQQQINKYLSNDRDFIDDDFILSQLKINKEPDPKMVRDIITKSLAIETLNLEETACLIRVKNRDLIQEMEDTALKVKKKVYDNRIVTFAPLYLGNFCVNDCLYCGFRKSNKDSARRVLNLNEVKKEIEVLAGEMAISA